VFTLFVYYYWSFPFIYIETGVARENKKSHPLLYSAKSKEKTANEKYEEWTVSRIKVSLLQAMFNSIYIGLSEITILLSQV